MIKASLINCLYNEKRTLMYLRLHNIVHQVPEKYFASNSCERVKCISEAIRVFHSEIKSKRHQLLQSEEECEKLRKITAHCRVLFNNLTDTPPDRVTLTKELQSIITQSTIIL